MNTSLLKEAQKKGIVTVKLNNSRRKFEGVIYFVSDENSKGESLVYLIDGSIVKRTKNPHMLSNCIVKFKNTEVRSLVPKELESSVLNSKLKPARGGKISSFADNHTNGIVTLFTVASSTHSHSNKKGGVK